jgi:CHAT domain-containing protein
VDVFENALGSDHPKVAAAIRSLARIEMERGEPELANRLLEKALTAQRLRLGDTHPDTTLTLLEQGQLLARSGKLKESAAKLCATLPLLEGAYGPEHPLVARYRMLLSRITVARGVATSCPKDDGVAANSAWDEALKAGRSVALHLERSFGAMTERQRQVFARDSLEVVGTLLSAPRASTTETYLATLPHRDSVLRSIASSRAAELDDDSKTQKIRAELKSKRRRYVAAVLGGTAEFAQRAADLAREIDQLTAAADRKPSVATSDPRQLLADACARLPDDAAVIEFIEYDLTVQSANISTVPRYAAFVIRGDDCRVLRVDLGPAAPVARLTERLDEAMNSGGYEQSGLRGGSVGQRGIGSSTKPRTGPRDPRSDWRELSRLLLAPLTEATRGIDRWLVVPDSSLWGVPLGALPDPLNEDRFFLERVVVGYLTSLYEVAAFTPRPVEVFSKPLLFGAPDFGTNKTGPRVLTGDGPCSLMPFAPLPGTLAELKDLRQVLGESVPMVIGVDASKQHFFDALRTKPSLVHLATHGYFAGRSGCYSASQDEESEWASNGLVDTNPLLLSGIVFAGANLATRIEAEGTSGILTAYEVAGLDLRQTRLLVLSACDTGTGLHQRAQEVQGMRWGFRAAGANALVVSLWPADDNVTPMLMNSFYQALKDQKPTDDLFRGAEALNRALKEVGSQFRDRPVLWANFVFSGIL